jgi:hypothetical protein
VRPPDFPPPPRQAGFESGEETSSIGVKSRGAHFGAHGSVSNAEEGGEVQAPQAPREEGREE